MKLLKFSFGIVLTLFFAGCQKEGETDYERARKKLDTDLWPAAANSQNPYESQYFGIYHNHALNYFRDQRPQYSSDQQWADEVYQISLDFFCAGSDVRYCEPDLDVQKLALLVDTASSDSLFALSLARLPAHVSAYVNTCLGYFESYTDSDYPALKNSIVQLETGIANDTALSPGHKQLLLCSTQIARYTGLYWKEQIADGFNQWPGVSIDMQHSDWGAVATDDIRGAVMGFIDGGPTGNGLKLAANTGPAASNKGATRFIKD